MFAYDPTAPLEVVQSASSSQGHAVVDELTYASPLGGRVPAFLVVPTKPGPHAGLIFMHPGQGNRSTFLAEAVALAEAGVTSFLIDAPYLRPGFAPAPGRPQGAPDADLYRQLVIDLRRGIDLLTARPDVDPRRIGYVGHSLGATWGGPLAGVEGRIRAFVLMAGYPRLTEWHRTSGHPVAVRLRSQFSPDEFERYLASLAPLDGVHYIGHASPAALLLQFARQDEFVTTQQAELYYTVASEPKELLWYETDHLFTGITAPRLDRARWLQARLGFDTLSDSMLAQLGAAEPQYLWK